MNFFKNIFNRQSAIDNCKTIFYCLLLIIYCQLSPAQTRITLQGAIDMALKNNLQIKGEKQKLDYQQKIIKTAFNIPLTTILAEYGQINSIYADNRFGVSQSFNFPTVYKKQKNLKKFILSFIFLGGLAQLVERLHGMQEVIGSNPLSSTKPFYKRKAFFNITPSSTQNTEGV